MSGSLFEAAESRPSRLQLMSLREGVRYIILTALGVSLLLVVVAYLLSALGLNIIPSATIGTAVGVGAGVLVFRRLLQPAPPSQDYTPPGRRGL